MALILLLFGGIALGLFLQTLALYLSTKIFKVANATFKTSLKVVVISIITGIILSIVLGIIGALLGLSSKSIILLLVSAIINFFVFDFLMKRYYLTQILKNLGIYITQLVLGLTLSLAILFPIISLRLFVIEPFSVSGSAMAPNFTNDQYILLQKWDKNYQRGDVVVHRHPKDQKQFFIKRVIGLPGEKVQIKDGYVWVNGVKLNEKDYNKAYGETYGKTVYGKEDIITLGSDEYYVLGDNRKASSDSRVWGTIPSNLIVGKYWITVSEKSK